MTREGVTDLADLRYRILLTCWVSHVAVGSIDKRSVTRNVGTSIMTANHFEVRLALE